MNNRIWLSPPHMGQLEKENIDEAFATNWIAPLGPFVDAFEKKLCAFTGSGHAAALSSGTAALHLSLILSGISPGDFILCPSFTFSATVNPVIYVNAKPVFIDSEKQTWNMSPVLLEEAISSLHKKNIRPKAIMIVHLYGMPAMMTELLAVAARHDLIVIEDAAESLGSLYKGTHTGTFSKTGVLSFNGNKIITTSGGGALISDDEELVAKARFLSTQARDKAPHYQHSQIGFNYRMSNISAAIGCGQMAVLPDRIAARRKNHELYKEAFAGIKEISFLDEPQGFFSNRWLTTVIINGTKVKREDIRLKLESLNIESRPLWKPMHMQPVFSSYLTFTDGTCESLFENGLCLPSGSALTDDERSLVIDTIKGLFR